YKHILGEALNWISINLEYEELKAATLKDVDNNARQKLETIDRTKFIIVGRYAWLKQNNFPLNQTTINFYKIKLDALLESKYEEVEESTEFKEIPKIGKRQLKLIVSEKEW